jgi:L-2,4-diaminobutyrate decarboxylase
MFATEPMGTINVMLGACANESENPQSSTRIADVFTPQLFRENVELVTDSLEQYLSDASIRGLALTDPQVLRAQAKQLMSNEQNGVPCSDQEKLKSIIDLYIKTGIQVHSPGYMGRQFSGVIPLAGIFDLVNSVVNQPSSFYEAGQLPNVAESLMAEEFNRFIGYQPDEFAMVTTSGASLANLTAILAARNDKYPDCWSRGFACATAGTRPAIAVSEDSHYSVTRAAGILGIGDQQIIRLPTNDKKQICIDKVCPALEKAKAQGLDVFCMVAAVGTTSVGAFDPVGELAKICQASNIWLHVDGAHGGSLLVSDKLRHKLSGIEQADSFVLDAHKMLFMPAMCTLLFYKDKRKSEGAFTQIASYVFEKEPDIYSEMDSASRNFECTKRPLIMNLWVCWMIYGKSLFAEKIEYLCQLTTDVHDLIDRQADFEVLHQPQANILCFRHLPQQLADELSKDKIGDFQIALRNKTRLAGKFFISKVDIDGVAALRVVFMNHEIKLDHVEQLLEEIRQKGRLILGKNSLSSITSETL